MPRYVTFFTYTSDAWAGMLEHPEDRAEAARTVIEGAGGELDCFGRTRRLSIYNVSRAVAALRQAALLDLEEGEGVQEGHLRIDRSSAKDALAASSTPMGVPAWRMQ